MHVVSIAVLARWCLLVVSVAFICRCRGLMVYTYMVFESEFHRCVDVRLLVCSVCV